MDSVVAGPGVAGILPPRQYLDAGGVRTAYHDAGAGPETVVLVYGGNFGSPDSASSAYAWNLQIGPLSRRYRVVVPDKLGQGFTGPPLRDEDYTIGAVVAHLRAFLLSLDMPPVHIVGHSRGGFAAARIAMQWPELIRSVTIVTSGTLSPGVGTNEVVLARPPHPPFTRESARWVYENYCFRKEVVTEDWMDVVVETLGLPEYRSGVDKMVGEGLGSALFLPDLARTKRETLGWIDEGRLQRPVQVVWGFNDRTALVERGVELFGRIARHERRTTLNVFNQSGHFPYREHPARFNALLAGFVELHRAR